MSSFVWFCPETSFSVLVPCLSLLFSCSCLWLLFFFFDVTVYDRGRSFFEGAYCHGLAVDRHQRSLSDHVAALVRVAARWCALLRTGRALPRTGGALWVEPRLFDGAAESRQASDHCRLLSAVGLLLGCSACCLVVLCTSVLVALTPAWFCSCLFDSDRHGFSEDPCSDFLVHVRSVSGFWPAPSGGLVGLQRCRW